MDDEAVERELEPYYAKIAWLTVRFNQGERSTVAAEAQTIGDELVCLLEEAASLKKRKGIDYLIDRVEELRAKASS